MIIGFCGKAGSGKNTAAARLPHLTDQPVVEIAFATILKKASAALLGVSVELLEASKNDPDVGVRFEFAPNQSIWLTLRMFWQRFGTEMGRDVFGPDFWVDQSLPLDGFYAPDAIYAVTDVRFSNESRRIQALGGVVVEIVGPESDAPVTHLSEQQEDLAPVTVIQNVIRDDDCRGLDAQLRMVLEGLAPWRD